MDAPTPRTPPTSRSEPAARIAAVSRFDDHVFELSTHQMVAAGVDPDGGTRVHDPPLPFAAVLAGPGVLDEAVLGLLAEVEGAVRLRHAEDPPALGRL